MTAQNAFQHLKSRGLPDHIAAGIVGNIQAESGFSEDVIAGRKLGDNGTAFGAFQHRGDRVKNLVDFARSNNLDPQRLETQLDFAIHEMTSGSDAGAKLALEEMLQTNDAGQAAQIFMQYFERPNADPNINKVDQRMYFAANMMQQGRGFKQALDEYQEQKQSDQNTQEAGSFAEQLKNYRAAQAGQTQVTDDAPQTQVPAAEFQAVSELPEIDGAIQKTMRDYQRIQTEGREAFNERNSKLAELLGKVGFSQSDEDVISQIQSIYPNAQFKQLEDGTNLVRFDGIEAVLNRPGVSGMDVSRFARDSAIIGVPSALTGGAGGVVLGGLGRLAGAGLGAGAGQIANDEMTNTADGVTSPSLERAAIATGAGVLGQGAASLVARFGPSVVNKVASLMGQNRYIKNGQPTQKAIQAFKSAGVPEDQITPDLIKEFARVNSIDDVAAARIADASSLPHPVKLTTGQATQSPRTLTLETAAKKGALGDELQGNALATQELQRQGLETNANIIRQNVAKGQPIAERGSGAAMAQSELTLKRETARKLVSARFKLAKQGNAGISADALSTFRNGLGKSLRADFDVEGLPNVSRLLSQLKAPANTKSINLGALETWRKRVSAAARSAAKGTQSNSATEAAALRRMLGSYDDAIQGSLSDAIVKGSTDDILLWRQAIAGRREFANRFETVPIIDKLSRKVNEGGERVLKVDPADAAATIFGRGILGRKAGLGRDLANLKRELSPQSWNAIKDEATLNLFAAADGTFRSGTEFAKRLDLFTRDAKGIYNQMFDAKERALLGQLSRVAKTIERRPPITGDMNPSGTGAMNAILNKGRSVGGPVGEFVTAFGTRIFDKTARAVKVAEASRYFAGVLEKRTVAVPAVYRAAGIELTNQGMTGQ